MTITPHPPSEETETSRGISVNKGNNVNERAASFRSAGAADMGRQVEGMTGTVSTDTAAGHAEPSRQRAVPGVGTGGARSWLQRGPPGFGGHCSARLPECAGRGHPTLLHTALAQI